MGIRYAIDSQIATIVMDDGKANALNPALLSELSSAFAQAREEARAVVLTGREGKFSAGFDLKVMMSGPEKAKEMVLAGAEFLLALYEFPKPVVMACTGHALAAGALLLATGDERIGASGPFKLGLNEVSASMPVPILAHELARDRLDPRHLTRSVLQAHIYDPPGALEAGWLDQVVEPGKLHSTALAAAQRLGELPAHAYAMTKKSLRRATIEHIRATVATNMLQITGG